MAVGDDVSSGVGDAIAVGVKVEIGDGVADKGIRVAGADGPKGEQPSPVMATIPKVQKATQNLLGTRDRIETLRSTDKCFIGNKQDVTGDNH